MHARRLALLLLLTALVVASGLGGVRATAQTRTQTSIQTSAPACSSASLVAWLDTQGNGAAGSVYYHLELTNLSSRPCTVRGYAGVSAVSLDGRQLGAAAGRDAVNPVKTITLASGQSASALLQVAEAANYPAARCRPQLAAGLRVYAPGQRASSRIPFPFEACSRSGVTVLHVAAFEKGSGS